MPVVSFPYGQSSQNIDIPDERFAGTLASRIHPYQPGKSPEALVEEAMVNPLGSPRLAELARGKRRVVLIASDHTRPVPSRVIVPRMLGEIRERNPGADITILIATGGHRGTTRDELINKFGPDIVDGGNRMANWFNERGIKTKRGTTLWRSTSVRAMIGNPIDQGKCTLARRCPIRLTNCGLFAIII